MAWARPRRSPPHTLKGEDLFKARLTPETWRLEIVGDGVQIEKPRKLDDGTAIEFPTLLELGKKHGVKFLKAMQCKTFAAPQGHGLWEGVPLREVLRLLVGSVGDSVRWVYWNGFHNNDPILGSDLERRIGPRSCGDLPPLHHVQSGKRLAA
jgi:hypothetical protein